MSRISRRSDRADAGHPRSSGGIEPHALEAWLGRTDGGFRRRMIGHDLEHLGIRHGDLLIEGERAPLRLGGVAMRLVTDFEGGSERLAGAGEVYLDADGVAAMRVDGQAWSLDDEVYSYVLAVAGWVPVRDGWPELAEARLLPQVGEEVVRAPRAVEVTPPLDIPPGEIPF